MNRRTMLLTGLAALAAPGPLRAQQPERVRRIAILNRGEPTAEISETSETGQFAPMLRELRRFGYVEGRNLEIDRWSALGDAGALAELARRVVAGKPELIVTDTTASTRAAQQATRGIPIIGIMADPIETGLVPSLARPGGNVTGVSLNVGGGEIQGKRLEFLRVVAPGIGRVGFLATADNWKLFGERHEANAAKLGLTVLPVFMAAPLDAAAYAAAFAQLAAQGADAYYEATFREALVHGKAIADLALAHRLPGVGAYRANVEKGTLMSFGTDVAIASRRLARYVQLVLQGADPGQLPIEQPMRFEFAVNLKTAKALGLTVPPHLLVFADEVIE
jgi:putative tryptophan/tyrosine transport system substrate-binding protein